MPVYTIPVIAGVATPDLSQGPIQYLLLTGNVTLAAPLNATAGQSWIVIVRWDLTGGWTLTLNAAYFADLSGLNTSANTQSQLTWVSDNNLNQTLNSLITGTAHP